MSPATSQPLTASRIAHNLGINVWRLGDLRSPEVTIALGEVEADLVIVACYNQLLPAGLYESRRLGGINLHPSLLPDKRGPDPLFWVFRNGDDTVGSTVHRLTSVFDSGGILAQKSTRKPDGTTEDALDAALAELGGDLLIDTVERLESGTAREQPQDETLASWAPHPAPEDFVLDPSMEARTAFNFVRGVQGRGFPIAIDLDSRRHQVINIVAWTVQEPSTADIPKDAQAIRLAGGWIIATIKTGNE